MPKRIMNEKQRHRLEQINSILEEKAYIPIKELSEILQVSEMTIRRDFSQFKPVENISLVNGVILRNPSGEEDAYELSVAGSRKWLEKEAIGKLAVSIIRPGEVIALDVGTTTEQIARFLTPEMDVTVICFSYNILSRLRHNQFSNIIFGGGVFREESQTFESEEAVRLIRKYRINKAFISAAGVSKDLGITCMNAYEVPQKRAVIESSAERILVFDSSKYNQVKPAYFADLDQFQTIITDNQISEEAENCYREKKIKILKT